ncbi:MULTISPECIES: hypothetical protein [unclassified Frankia]|nr:MULTISPECIES: hypothetical protein [unclassified Frankia]
MLIWTSQSFARISPTAAIPQLEIDYLVLLLPADHLLPEPQPRLGER